KDGRFHFPMPRADFDRSLGLKWWENTRLLAAAPGLGPDVIVFRNPARSDGLTLRLVEDLPIRGRVLDADGKPVGGAKVRVAGFSAFDDAKGVTDILDGVRTQAYGGDVGIGVSDRAWIGPVPGQPREVTTGADGRFRLNGLGRDRQVRLHVEGS